MIPKQYLIGGLALALIASHSSLAWFARDYGKDQERLKWQTAENTELQKTLEAVSSIQNSADALKQLAAVRRRDTAALNTKLTGFINDFHKTDASNAPCLNPAGLRVLRSIQTGDQAKVLPDP